jgi:hypothetical protein
MRNYPINFVVKHPNRLVFFADGPPLGGRKTCLPNPKTWRSLFPDRLSLLFKNGKLKALCYEDEKRSGNSE